MYLLPEQLKHPLQQPVFIQLIENDPQLLANYTEIERNLPGHHEYPFDKFEVDFSASDDKLVENFMCELTPNNQRYLDQQLARIQQNSRSEEERRQLSIKVEYALRMYLFTKDMPQNNIEFALRLAILQLQLRQRVDEKYGVQPQNECRIC